MIAALIFAGVCLVILVGVALGDRVERYRANAYRPRTRRRWF